MIYCNIWIGGEAMPENRKKCVNSFINFMENNDSYFLINDDNIDEIYQEALKNNSDWWRIYSERKVQFKTDFIRLYLACNIPNLFYADTDVLMGKQFNFDNLETDKPMLGQWMNISETFLFYVNGQCQYFKFLMKLAEKFNPENVFFPSHLFTFPKVQKNIAVFNEETFSHQRLGKY